MRAQNITPIRPSATVATRLLATVAATYNKTTWPVYLRQSLFYNAVINTPWFFIDGISTYLPVTAASFAVTLLLRASVAAAHRFVTRTR